LKGRTSSSFLEQGSLLKKFKKTLKMLINKKLFVYLQPAKLYGGA